MGKRERRRVLVSFLLLIAAVVSLLLAYRRLETRGREEPTPSAVLQTGTPAPEGTPEPAPAITASPTPEPTSEPTPSPTPEPTPEPTPAPWNLVLVNRDHPVPEDWEVQALELPDGKIIDRRIYEPLMEMFEAAKEANAGILPVVYSGYRTPERQQEIFDEYVQDYLSQGWSEADARAEAEKWVALPGTSEHQLGIAVDIAGAVYDVFDWLGEHSWEYGFILRYPPDKTGVTGINGEQWHYRYVGLEAAREIHELGVTLEEYLALPEA